MGRFFNGSMLWVDCELFIYSFWLSTNWWHFTVGGSLRCSLFFVSLRYILYWSNWFSSTFLFLLGVHFFFLTRIWIFENLLLTWIFRQISSLAEILFFSIYDCDVFFFFWFNKKSIEALFFCSDSCSMNELLWSYWTDKEPRLPFFFRIIISFLL